jgi:uncharacterized protein DUF6893
MNDIHINRTAQLLVLLALLTGVGALIVLQLPELKRYMNIRSM